MCPSNRYYLIQAAVNDFRISFEHDTTSIGNYFTGKHLLEMLLVYPLIKEKLSSVKNIAFSLGGTGNI